MFSWRQPPVQNLKNLSRTTQRRSAVGRQLSIYGAHRKPAVETIQNGLPLTSARTLNTGPNPILSNIANSDSRFRISYTLAALTALGLGATAWGLFEFYAMLTMWPEEVRGDLRAGLRAKARGDMKLSQRHLMRAWQAVRTLPTSKLEPEPYLKISGVAIVLAEAFEDDGRLADAYATLAAALALLLPRFKSLGGLNGKSEDISSLPSESADIASEDILRVISSASNPVPSLSSLTSNAPSSSQLKGSSRNPSRYSLPASPAVRKRAAALALKLADLSEVLQRPSTEEEALLSFATEEVMRLIYQDNVFDSAINTEVEKSNREKGKGKAIGIEEIPDADLELPLPSWANLTRTEVAAPMERLAAFYAKQGKDGYALALYNGALNLLLPSSSSGRSIPESCQALQILSAQLALLAELSTAHPDDPYPARSFMEATQRALAIYGAAYNRSGGNAEGAQNEEMALCEDVYPAILYNAAVFHEGRGELDTALQLYARSVPRLQKSGSSDQAYEAQAGLRRVKRELDRRQSKQS